MDPAKVNSFSSLKTFALGLADVALLTANITLLRAIIDGGHSTKHYPGLLGLLITSIVLQCTSALLLLIMFFSRPTPREPAFPRQDPDSVSSRTAAVVEAELLAPTAPPQGSQVTVNAAIGAAEAALSGRAAAAAVNAAYRARPTLRSAAAAAASAVRHPGENALPANLGATAVTAKHARSAAVAGACVAALAAAGVPRARDVPVVTAAVECLMNQQQPNANADGPAIATAAKNAVNTQGPPVVVALNNTELSSIEKAIMLALLGTPGILPGWNAAAFQDNNIGEAGNPVYTHHISPTVRVLNASITALIFTVTVLNIFIGSFAPKEFQQHIFNVTFANITA